MKPEEGARKQIEIYRGMSEKEIERRARQRMTDGAIRGSQTAGQQT